MTRTGTVLGLVLVVVVAGAGAGVLGIGPLSGLADELPGVLGNTDGGDQASSSGSSGGTSGGSSSDGGGGDSSGGSSGDDGSSSGDASSGDASSGDGQSKPFSIRVVSIEKCGQTCRDVTMRLVNKRNQTVTGVNIDATLFAGKGTDGKNVWEGSADVGELEPEGQTEITRRVKLGFGDALAVNNNDGWVTVKTVVTSDSKSATFTEQKDVL